MQRLVVLLVSFCMLASGCVSLQGVPLPDKAGVPAAVKAGEKVEITTRSGQTHTFKVTRVTEEAIEGEGVRVAYADMTSLQAQRNDPAQTGVVLWIVLGVVALITAFYILEDTDEIGAAASTR